MQLEFQVCHPGAEASRWTRRREMCKAPSLSSPRSLKVCHCGQCFMEASEAVEQREVLSTRRTSQGGAVWPQTTLSRGYVWGTGSNTLIPYVCVSAVCFMESLSDSNHDESDTGKNSSQVGANGRGSPGHLGDGCCLECGAGESET